MEATRAHLIEHARQLFQEKGYKYASISQLIERAGGSKETVYRHFKDKAAILAAVFDTEVDHYDARLRGLRKIDDPDVQRGLTQYAIGILLDLTSERAITLRQMMIAEAQSRPDVGRLYYSHQFLKGYKLFESCLKAYQDSGQLRPIDTARLAGYFGAMLLHRALLMRQCAVTKPMAQAEAHQLASRVVTDFLVGFGT
jgi:TetR/AcrR family transcriptional regulator, mexJK operon transcriptional repressor